MNENDLLVLSFKNPIILYDGDCILCSGFIQWLLKRDKKALFRYAALQTLSKNTDMKSIKLLTNGNEYEKSLSVLRILQSLGGLWSITRIFQIIPRFFRDGVYDFIARNRYKWFGRKANCLVISPDLRSRFIL